MRYEEAFKKIAKCLFVKYKSIITTGRVDDNKASYSLDRQEIFNALPELNFDTLQPYIDQMYEAGYLTKDDGRAVYFSPDFVKSTRSMAFY